MQIYVGLGRMGARSCLVSVTGVDGSIINVVRSKIPGALQGKRFIWNQCHNQFCLLGKDKELDLLEPSAGPPLGFCCVRVILHCTA